MKTLKKSGGEIHPRKLPSQPRAEKRVAAIISAYKRLLVGDARSITTNGLAKEVGIPVSSVYQYFPNKESIAFAVYQQWAESVIKILRERKLDAQSATHWLDYLEHYKSDFFGRIRDAKFVNQLSLVMDSSSELKKVQRRYLEEMANIVAETLRILGSDWPEKKLASVVNLSFELNSAAFRYVARQPGDAAEETYHHWEVISHALLKRVIETPYEEVEQAATKPNKLK